MFVICVIYHINVFGLVHCRNYLLAFVATVVVMFKCFATHTLTIGFTWILTIPQIRVEVKWFWAVDQPGGTIITGIVRPTVYWVRVRAIQAVIGGVAWTLKSLAIHICHTY